jgi:hypothetical protein
MQQVRQLSQVTYRGLNGLFAGSRKAWLIACPCRCGQPLRDVIEEAFRDVSAFCILRPEDKPR